MSCEGCPSQGNCSKDASMCSVQPNPKNKIKHIVAVLSGKGGVGKSTITVLLARALSKKGYKVGIMDADITSPSIPRLMDAQNEQAYATRENEVIPVDVDGIKIVSLNYMLENENDPVIWRGPIVGNVVKQFYTDVLWEDLDYLLIDMPPGTGDVALTILQELPVEAVLMVSTPQPMVSMIVTKAIKMCDEMHVRVLGVIENMAYLECPYCFPPVAIIAYILAPPIHELNGSFTRWPWRHPKDMNSPPDTLVPGHAAYNKYTLGHHNMRTAISVRVPLGPQRARVTSPWRSP
ncbi:Mrp/NBP35 family ATP-binding protein [Dubosiella newyorkensis]|uniref:Mrp/NBP35 family ATP-binding protein n=1 Tax=Dubosiella newyorkensis TaxID=1862672 RepID=UPI003F737D2C